MSRGGYRNNDRTKSATWFLFYFIDNITVFNEVNRAPFGTAVIIPSCGVAC